VTNSRVTIAAMLLICPEHIIQTGQTYVALIKSLEKSTGYNL